MGEKGALISVIIPVYNVEKYLKKCLDSVINQTFRNIEIICINDGSTDNSLQILNEYAEKDSRIKIVNKQNGGLSSARNAGLDIAEGEYCYFVDSDDWIELNTLEKMYNIIISNDVDTVVHNAINIPEDESCEYMANETQVWLKTFEKISGVYDVPIDINAKIPTVAWNKLYKMSIIKEFNCRFPVGLINEDELFIWTYMIHCKKYYYLDERLYNYLRRSNSIMAKRDNNENILDILDILEEIYKTVEKYKNIEDYREYLTLNYINQVNWLFYRIPNKYKKQALRKIMQYYEITSKDNKIKELYNMYKYEKIRKFLGCFKQFIQKIFSITNIHEGRFIGQRIMLFGIEFKLADKYQMLSNRVSYVEDKFHRLYHVARNIADSDVVPNKIVFNNFNGKGYGCNPKYIAEEIIKQKLPYELVWLVKDVYRVREEFPKEIRLVEYNVENAIREFSTAKIWISNQRMPELYINGLFKKKNQYYIQTWHGSLGIKKCERSIENIKQWWCKWAKVDAQYVDNMVANSEWESNLFYRDLWCQKEIYKYGHARNDMFYNEKLMREISDKVRSILNIEKDLNIALYAPTFRDQDYSNLDDNSYYDLDIVKTKEALEKKFGGKWVFAVRLHPNVSKDVNKVFENKSYIVNATDYPDVQELLASSDLLISDYSSCMFDFVLMNKPCFIFAKDLNEYTMNTGFYYDLKTTPFSIAEDNDTLVRNIMLFDKEKYSSDVKDFLTEKGCIEDGHAAERIVSVIKEKINIKI